MHKRILILGGGEFNIQDIKLMQREIKRMSLNIELLLEPDRICAICSIEYSICFVLKVFSFLFTNLFGDVEYD